VDFAVDGANPPPPGTINHTVMIDAADDIAWRVGVEAR